MSGAHDVLVPDMGPASIGFESAPRLTAATKGLRYAIALLLLLGAFVADLDTGYDLTSSLFYIVPVAFAAWFVGRRPGLVTALVSSLAWFAAQRLDRVSISHPGILYANAGVECVIYLGAAWAVARVHANRIAERLLSARVVEANQALEREFLAVGELQRGLLPSELPRVDGYLWEVHYATSARAGGDYYDAFPLPGGRIGVIVADATGHGAPAAVLMGMARALLRAEPESRLEPDEVLTRLNRQLGRVLPPGWFVTACYVVIEPARGRFAYSLAGHDAPLIVRARDGAVEQVQGRGGPPLGPYPSHGYQAGSAELEPGDTLVLFTDGVIETRSPDHELFGVERLRDTLAGTSRCELADAKRRLLNRLDRHAAGARMEDDTTILMLRRPGCPAADRGSRGAAAVGAVRRVSPDNGKGRGPADNDPALP